MNKTYTSDYLLSEILKLWEMMGTKLFWSDLERSSLALKGLLYAYSHTEDMNETLEKHMLSVTIEYDRRLAYMI